MSFQAWLSAINGDNTPWQEMPFGIVVASVLDSQIAPPDEVLAELEETELGKIIAQFKVETLNYIPREAFKRWKDAFDDLNSHDLRGMSPVCGAGLHGETVWSIHLEVLCKEVYLTGYWVIIENINDTCEAIQILNREPQYRLGSSPRFFAELQTGFYSIIPIVRQ